MKCKRCGSDIKSETKCQYCGFDNSKEYEPQPSKFQSYQRYDKTDVIKEEFEDFGLSWYGHLLVGLVAYIAMYVMVYIFFYLGTAIFAGIKHIDFTEIRENKEAYANALFQIENIAQVIAYIGVIAIFVVVFRKKIKQILKGFKEADTYKWGFLCFAMMYGALIVYSFILVLSGKQSSSTNQEAVDEIIFKSPVCGFLFVCILAPLFEELVFRFGVFRSIAKWNAKWALAITTIVFAGVHLLASIQGGKLLEDMYSIPTYIIGAFFITYSYYKTKKLSTSIFLHSFYNTLSYVIIIVGSLQNIGQ